MQLEPEEAQQIPAVAAFIAELRHWREVKGYSQKALAKLVGYTPSYVSKVERGTMAASREFAAAADEHLRAGRSRPAAVAAHARSPVRAIRRQGATW